MIRPLGTILIAGLSQEDSEGRLGFFPFGFRNRGYVLPERLEGRVRRSLSLLVALSLGLLGLSFVLLGGKGVLVVAFPMLAYPLVVRLMLRGCERTSPLRVAPSSATVVERLGAALGIWPSLVLTVSAAFMLAISPFVWAATGSELFAAAYTTFFAVTLVADAAVLLEAWRRRRSAPPGDKT